jgi:hypothetical protein
MIAISRATSDHSASGPCSWRRSFSSGSCRRSLAAAPRVTINKAAGQADPTGSAPINYTVVFSESVTGFATGDVSFAGTTAGGTLLGTVTGSGTTYNVSVTGMTTAGDVVATIPAAVAQNGGAEDNVASSSSTVAWGLTVTINQGASQADPTGASTINFTVVFSSSVSDFATGDVSFAGSTAGGRWSVPCRAAARATTSR